MKVSYFEVISMVLHFIFYTSFSNYSYYTLKSALYSIDEPTIKNMALINIYGILILLRPTSTTNLLRLINALSRTSPSIRKSLKNPLLC